MCRRQPARCGLLVVWAVVAIAGTAAAQAGRVGGVVKDETGQPLKGATVMAENPEASPNSFTATTDDKGRFSIIGLRAGSWTFTAQSPGFVPETGRLRVQTIGPPNPPLTFTLKKGAPAPGGVLGGMAAKDLQAELRAADEFYNAEQWDQAVAAYKALLAKAPALSVINLQIGQAYRNKAADLKRQDPKADVRATYDQAMAAYTDLLKIDANSDKAKIGVAMVTLERGDIDQAETMLEGAAQTPNASKDVFYNLGEVKFAKGKNAEAISAYERAVEMDPNWGKPVFAMAKVALNKGDKGMATALMQKVIQIDPLSPEAVQAQMALEQLKK
jgi:Flp pilus assembly protein TadD